MTATADTPPAEALRGLVQVCDEAFAIIDAYEPPAQPLVEDQPRRVMGHGATEAPRGMLYPPLRARHDGTILDARIVPPTSPNQLVIEEDLRAFAQRNVELPDEALRLRCEQAIPNHDPCISCATHFLELTVQRG